MRDFGEDSLWEVYGSTELGVDTVLAPPDHRRKPGSCGRAVPGVEIRLYDESGAEVTEPGVPGEVFVRSVNVFEAYYKAKDKTAATRREGFATVGDIAYRDADGFYYICDRKSDMIISGGMNIYPAEIEAALERHPDVADVAVFGIPSEEWGESVHAVMVPRLGQSPSSRRHRRLRAGAARRLQDPAVGVLRGGDPPQRLRQDPQARAARALLAGPHPEGGLSAVDRHAPDQPSPDDLEQLGIGVHHSTETRKGRFVGHPTPASSRMRHADVGLGNPRHRHRASRRRPRRGRRHRRHAAVRGCAPRYRHRSSASRRGHRAPRGRAVRYARACIGGNGHRGFADLVHDVCRRRRHRVAAGHDLCGNDDHLQRRRGHLPPGRGASHTASSHSVSKGPAQGWPR